MPTDTQEPNSHVHPLIAGILNDFMTIHHKALKAEYLTDLRTMDWQFEFSEDGMRRRQGRDKWARIRELQPIVDDSAELFRAHRPNQHGAPDLIGRALVVTAEQAAAQDDTMNFHGRAA